MDNGPIIFQFLSASFSPKVNILHTVLLWPFVCGVWPVTPDVHYSEGSKVHVICDRCPFWDRFPHMPWTSLTSYNMVPFILCLLYFPFILIFIYLLIYCNVSIMTTSVESTFRIDWGMLPNYSPIVLCNPPLFKTLTMSTPDEWCAWGRTWDSIPQSMKKIAEQILEVPENHASELLPSPHISINVMLKFPLLNLTLSLPTSNTQLYFSHKQPDFLNDTLVLSFKHPPIPTASIIQQLSADAPQAWLDGYNSVKYTHLAEMTVTHFPLWVITLWNSILDIHANIQKPWHKACNWAYQAMAKITTYRGTWRMSGSTLLMKMICWTWCITKSQAIQRRWCRASTLKMWI